MYIQGYFNTILSDVIKNQVFPELLPVIGMAASSLLKHRYSPSNTMTTRLAMFITHQAGLWGIPP